MTRSAVTTWAIAGLALFGILLLVTIVVTFTSSDLVVPRVSLEAQQQQTAANTQGTAGTQPSKPQSAEEILAARTQLLRWRADVGPAPGNPAPQAAPSEQQVITSQIGVDDPRALVRSWQNNRPLPDDAIKNRGFVEGSSSVPYPKLNVFEQPQGRVWREARNDAVRFGGGWWVFGVGLLLALFLLFRGRIPLERGFSRESVLRFGSLERANHWMTATSFIVMAITGVIILYGKPILLPLMSHDAFGWVARVSAWVHMAFAVPFVIGILLMITLWLVDNFPTRADWVWVKRGGGFMNDDPNKPPAYKFNAGQKLVFWGVVLSGLALLASGLALMFPFYWLGYTGMQWAQIAHAVIALLMIGLIFGHIYIGTIGMEGAFDAMWSGRVDRNWAMEHHRYWYEKVTGREVGDPRDRERPQPAE